MRRGVLGLTTEALQAHNADIEMEEKAKMYPKRTAAQSIKRMAVHMLLLALLLYVIYMVRGGIVLGKLTGSNTWLMLTGAEEDNGEFENALAATAAALSSYDSDVRTFLHSLDMLAPLIEKRDFQDVIEIPRFTEAELPFLLFKRRYEEAGLPVIVKNLSLIPKMWDRAYIRKVCSSSMVQPLVPDKPTDGGPSRKWAGLKSLDPMSVGKFFDLLDKKQKPSPYMHDWSLPDKCPQLLQNYTVPKYFTQDYLRRVKVSADGWGAALGATRKPYSKSWPSLFVGEKSTGSGIHIDSGDTHFVMYMIEGVKEFRLIRRRDRIVAYEDRDEGSFMGNLFKPDFAKHPLLALATVYKATLRPGDMLFIPAGSPHQVVNHEPIISISTNYVDETNVEQAIRQFREQMINDVADGLQEQHDKSELVTRSNPKSMLWPAHNKQNLS